MRLGDIFVAANKLGALEWRKRHLDPLLNASKFGHCSSDREALFASLDAELGQTVQFDRQRLRVDLWFERREEELIERDWLIKLVADWAIERASELAVRFLCEVLTYFGERRDLLLLDRLPRHLHLA